MARILFGGPQEKERDHPISVHDNLVARLRAEGHIVDYETRGDLMMGRLAAPGIPSLHVPYHLVMYDTGLFYDESNLQARSELFRTFAIGALNLAKAPVIVLADQEIAGLIQVDCKHSGFRQINQPYEIAFVINQVYDALESHEQ